MKSEDVHQDRADQEQSRRHVKYRSHKKPIKRIGTGDNGGAHLRKVQLAEPRYASHPERSAGVPRPRGVEGPRVASSDVTGISTGSFDFILVV